MTCVEGHPIRQDNRFCAVCGASNPDYVKAALPVAVATSGMRPIAYVVIGWNVLMGAWILWALVQARHSGCASATYQHACRAGETVGAGIAIVLILFVAAVGDIALGVIYMVTNRNR